MKTEVARWVIGAFVLLWEWIKPLLFPGFFAVVAWIASKFIGRFASWAAYGGVFFWLFPDLPLNRWWLLAFWLVLGAVFLAGYMSEEEYKGKVKKWRRKVGGAKQPAALTCLAPVFEGRANIKAIKKSVFTIKVGHGIMSGHGSGFCIAPGGWALTNQHVVGGEEYFEATINDGGKFLTRAAGKCVYASEKPDIALVKIDADMEPLRLNFDIPEEGDSIRVIGTPLDADKEGTVTSGVISAIRETKEHGTLIQSDASVHLGNSGGPMIDEYGNVIGVTVLKHQGGGINYFIPIKEAMLGIKHKMVKAVERIG